jgi:hypothetical protein
MKFSLQLSRMVTEEKDKKKFENLGFHFQVFDKSSWPYNTNLRKDRYVSINSPEVHFEDLKDLKKFLEKVGEAILRDDNVIEII